jgi:hypothetical protein
MTVAVGVLCARVRVEEKQIMTALGDAGAMGMPVPPTILPLPPRPAQHDLMAMLPALGDDSIGGSNSIPSVMIDRATNRQAARPLGRLLRQAGIHIVDAGLASTRNRQEVATAWAVAGLPRPKTLVAFSEATGVQAAEMVGFPATLLPLIPGTETTSLLDADTADAVIEHRIVLGTADEAVVLLQAGTPAGDDIVRIHVVGGNAIAWEGTTLLDGAAELASRAATAINAEVVAIDIARSGSDLVVWDAQPVADFRTATPIGETGVGEAIAALATARALRQPPRETREVRHVVAISA